MATVKIILDKRRAKRDGTYPLVFRVRHKGKYFDIPTPYSLEEHRYNPISGIKGGKALTNELSIQRDELSIQLLTIVSSNPNIGIKELRVLMRNEESNKDISLKYLWEEEIEALLKANRSGGAKVHQTSLNRISKIIDTRKPIKCIMYTDIELIETKLYEEGVSTNSIGVYLRSLRTICNKAIKRGITEQSWYPFIRFKIKAKKTTPKPLSLTEIQQYFSLNIERSDRYYKAYNLGKLIFMLRGINLIDLLMLTKDNLENGRIIYNRSKTGKQVSISITPEIENTLGCFWYNGLTLLSELDEFYEDLKCSPEILEKYVQVRKVVNSHLKKIGQELGLKNSLTTYSFRYTYANIAKQLGYSKDLISEALSHSYGNSVTGIYLEAYDVKELDEMNDNIINSITKGSAL